MARRCPSVHANLLARLEFDRTLAALDGDTMIGTAGAFSFQMRVPDAMAAGTGVSLVAVLTSYRRQGILSALMRRQLADVNERDEAVAVRFCSESGIYGQYGYRRTSWQAAYRLQGGRGRAGVRGTGRPRPAAADRRTAVIIAATTVEGYRLRTATYSICSTTTALTGGSSKATSFQSASR